MKNYQLTELQALRIQTALSTQISKLTQGTAEWRAYVKLFNNFASQRAKR